MDYPKFIVTNQKEESIIIQWVNKQHNEILPMSDNNECLFVKLTFSTSKAKTKYMCFSGFNLKNSRYVWSDK